jgi:hypothetical protein
MLLSLSFLIIAVIVGATHRNWKELANKNKEIADRARLRLEDAKNKSTEIQKKLNAEQVARQHQLSQLESQLAIARQQRDEKETQLREQTVISQQALEAVNASEKRIKEQDNELAQLKTENVKLTDDIAEQRRSVVNLTNVVYQLRGEIEVLEQLRKDMGEQLVNKIKVMNKHGLKDDDLVDHIPPKVDGVVLQVKERLITVSLGTDDGIRNGHTLDIYRGDRFVGQAVVTNANFNLSAARIDNSLTQSQVREGDHVTTKFNGP